MDEWEKTLSDHRDHFETIKAKDRTIQDLRERIKELESLVSRLTENLKKHASGNCGRNVPEETL